MVVVLTGDCVSISVNLFGEASVRVRVRVVDRTAIEVSAGGVD